MQVIFTVSTFTVHAQQSWTMLILASSIQASRRSPVLVQVYMQEGKSNNWQRQPPQHT